MKNNFGISGQWKTFWTITWYSLRAQTRNMSTFFFGFLFPVVFISIFGLIGNSTTVVNIGIPPTSNMQNPIYTALNKISFVKLNKSNQLALEKQLKLGKIDAIVNIIKQDNVSHYTVNVLEGNTNPQNAQIVNSVITQIVDKTNLILTGMSNNPPVNVNIKSTSVRQLRYIDFALPGMIGFSLLSTAIFGTVFGLIFLKKTLVIKRMFATPMHPLIFLTAQGTSRLIVVLIQTILILLIGVFVFKFYLPDGMITFLQLVLLSIFGLIAFLGFGYFMAGLTNDENAANPMINLVTLPQFLLSGTFFPTSSLPNWLEPIANNLPLSYFNIAVRNITTSGEPFSSTLPYLLGMFVWSMVMYVLAARTFKWE